MTEDLRFDSRLAWGTLKLPTQRFFGITSFRVKGLQREANHSPLSTAGFKNSWMYTSAHPLVFMT
jgi:hypothetical protein